MREVVCECCFKTNGKCPYEQGEKDCTQGFEDNSLGMSLCDITDAEKLEWRDEWNPEILFADGSFKEGLKEFLITIADCNR